MKSIQDLPVSAIPIVALVFRDIALLQNYEKEPVLSGCFGQNP